MEVVSEIKSGSKILKLDKPRIMGILNVTPDSFSDGGKFNSLDQAVQRFDQMIEEGADIIDIGGESTGPGSKEVTLEEEIKRVIPVLKAVRQRSDIMISVDTYKCEVAKRAIAHGADMINDVLALRGELKCAEQLAKLDIPIVLMYSKDNSGRTTGEMKKYEDVVEDIKNFFELRIKTLENEGISRNRFILDPGQGAFVSGDPKYSLEIIRRLGEFKDLGLPILIGSSRKSFIGQTLNLPLHERLEGSIACAVVAYINGASILRVHDVKETRRALDMTSAILNS